MTPERSEVREYINKIQGSTQAGGVEDAVRDA